MLSTCCDSRTSLVCTLPSTQSNPTLAVFLAASFYKCNLSDDRLFISVIKTVCAYVKCNTARVSWRLVPGIITLSRDVITRIMKRGPPPSQNRAGFSSLKIRPCKFQPARDIVYNGSSVFHYLPNLLILLSTSSCSVLVISINLDHDYAFHQRLRETGTPLEYIPPPSL